MAEWFEEGLDDDLKAHVTTKGWNKPLDAAVARQILISQREAEKLVGVPAEHVVRMPRDITDPAFQTLYDRVMGMAAPATGDAYKFDGVKFADGAAPNAGFLDGWRKTALDSKAPQPVAEAFLRYMATQHDATQAEERNAGEIAKGARSAALRGRWGAAYDVNAFAAQRAREVAGLPQALLDSIERLDAQPYVEAMEALRNLGARMNESEMARGVPGHQADETAGLNATQAFEAYERHRADPEWVKKYNTGDAGAVATFDKLHAIMATEPATIQGLRRGRSFF